MTAEAIINDGLAQLRADLLRRAIGERATLAEALDLAREAWSFLVDGGNGRAEEASPSFPELAADFKQLGGEGQGSGSQPSPYRVAPRTSEERLAANQQVKTPAMIGGPNRKTWSAEEDDALIEMRIKGASGGEIARALGRGPSSVFSRIDRLKSLGRLVEPVGSIAGDQYKVRD